MQPKSSLHFLFSFFIYGACLVAWGCNTDRQTSDSIPHDAMFVGSDKCKSCHVQEFEDWITSDHFLAMQEASDSTVLGDFNNAVFMADGVTNKFFKKEGKYYINTEGDDGQYQDFQILYTFGFYPLQQYLIAFPGGRLQSTRASWDSREKKWFHQYANQQIDHRDWFHWTGNSQNWNTMCASCHSTNLQKGYDFEKDTYTTTWDEINVSCESCHGPGSTHIDYINSNSYKKGEFLKNAGLTYARDTTPQLQLNACAACHARQSTISPNFLNTEEILDDLIPQVISNEFYFPDGQIMEEDYEYGSFAQSKMFHNNVRCSSCHNPHSGKLRLEGNNLCLSCHTPNYNTEDHHFHEPDTESSQCVNCHMVARTYMGVDHRRDHSFRVPRPDQSLLYGTPNACNTCHLEQSPEWAAAAVQKWYGPKRTYHFSDDLIPGSLLNDQSEFHLQKLLADTTQPEIARATAAYYMGNIQTMKCLEALIKALGDKKALVRFQALRSLESFPPDRWQHKAHTALHDPVRAVRIAAADLYLKIPKESLPTEVLHAFEAANQENIDFLKYQTDFSVGNVMMGDYSLQVDALQDAVKYYKRGLAKDSLMNYARLNLATTYSILGRNQDAAETLISAAQIDSQNDRIYYNLGLLYNEMGNFTLSLEYFQYAVDIGSVNPSLYYNYGLALQQQSFFSKAEKILLQGLQLDPLAINLNYAICLFYIQQEKNAKALEYGQRLKASEPLNPDFQAIFQELGI